MNWVQGGALLLFVIYVIAVLIIEKLDPLDG